MCSTRASGSSCRISLATWWKRRFSRGWYCGGDRKCTGFDLRLTKSERFAEMRQVWSHAPRKSTGKVFQSGQSNLNSFDPQGGAHHVEEEIVVLAGAHGALGELCAGRRSRPAAAAAPGCAARCPCGCAGVLVASRSSRSSASPQSPRRRSVRASRPPCRPASPGQSCRPRSHPTSCETQAVRVSTRPWPLPTS